MQALELGPGLDPEVTDQNVAGPPERLERFRLASGSIERDHQLAPSALAISIVRALRDGVEDIYPGDVAQDIITRFRESQKVLERELWGQ